VISSWGGVRRGLPYAFTEHGIVMVSSVLRSRHAIEVNIAVVRAFVKLRHALEVRKDLNIRVERLEGKINLVETDVRQIRNAVQHMKRIPEKTGPTVKGFEKE